MLQKLDDLNWEMIRYPPHSKDIAPLSMMKLKITESSSKQNRNTKDNQNCKSLAYKPTLRDINYNGVVMTNECSCGIF